MWHLTTPLVPKCQAQGTTADGDAQAHAVDVSSACQIHCRVQLNAVVPHMVSHHHSCGSQLSRRRSATIAQRPTSILEVEQVVHVATPQRLPYGELCVL